MLFLFYKTIYPIYYFAKVAKKVNYFLRIKYCKGARFSAVINSTKLADLWLYSTKYAHYVKVY